MRSIAAAVVMLASVSSCASGAAGGRPVAFKEATLIVEINATDGDAGLQVFLDHEPWRSIAIARPDGTKILDIGTHGRLSSYGLTELFSESSEPPFDRFPLTEFVELFPKGTYEFTGETIEGRKLRSAVKLSHAFPEGPQITSPGPDSQAPSDRIEVRWAPGSQPAGVVVAGYRVIVTRESDPVRVFHADLPATARSLRVPPEFFEPGAEYKAEVLAVEASGNQTLTEVAFTTT